jgi:2-polyprenyl-3-methyl-5-hydroxy-6-metoxy-1,4-benzoquinol methylase
MDVIQLDQLSDSAIRHFEWYYRVELRPGVFTGGRRRGTLAMVRHQLAKMGVRGRRCLDLGTQEGAVATVLARAGATRVVAYDRLDLSDRISLVKQSQGVEFDYQHSCPLDDLPSRLLDGGQRPFDVVVFAGVLYHMIDPLGGLAQARSFVREGGLLLLETSAVVDTQPLLHFNAAGHIYPGSNYFQPTLGALDYFLRMLRLQVIDCHYEKGGRVTRAGGWLRWLVRRSAGQLCRVSVVCRAIDRPLPVAGDRWMPRQFIVRDVAARQLEFSRLNSTDPAVEYQRGKNRVICHPDFDSVDLYRSVTRGNRFVPDEEWTELRLPASAGASTPTSRAA